ncbi:MAG: DUF3553 domain-containing protein [Alkalilacustris sp.]
MLGANAILGPGMLVRNPARPEWGLGQVQSCVGTRITVSFAEEGKVVIDGSVVELHLVSIGNDPP